MKKYVYKKSTYMAAITFSGVIGIVVGLMSIYKILINSNRVLWALVLLVCVYTVIEIFVSGSNPSVVEYDDEVLRFTSYGKVDEYKWSDITSFNIKGFATQNKIFLRINNPNLFKGRYWVNCFQMDDETDVLYRFFLDKEYEIEPTRLKQNGRNMELKRQKRLKEKQDIEEARLKEEAKAVEEQKEIKDSSEIE